MKNANGVLTTRPAVEEDLESIRLFPLNAEEAFFMFPKATYPLSREELTEAMHRRWDATVAERGGEMAGYANFYEVRDGSYCSMGNVVVSPSFRRRGVASFLIKEMAKIAHERHGATELRLSCFCENRAGLLLYLRLGFAPYAMEKRVKRDGSETVLIEMRKCIKSDNLISK